MSGGLYCLIHTNSGSKPPVFAMKTGGVPLKMLQDLLKIFGYQINTSPRLISTLLSKQSSNIRSKAHNKRNRHFLLLICLEYCLNFGQMSLRKPDIGIADRDCNRFARMNISRLYTPVKLLNNFFIRAHSLKAFAAIQAECNPHLRPIILRLCPDVIHLNVLCRFNGTTHLTEASVRIRCRAISLDCILSNLTAIDRLLFSIWQTHFINRS